MSGADDRPSPAGVEVRLSWHQALAYALTGHRLPELGQQSTPDLAELADWLRRTGHEPDTSAYAVPTDLMLGLGPAQFWAALTRLRADLAPAAPPSVPPVLADRGLTADERRLTAEVPPHHGS